jgi:uncharacterized protein YndB with AHSA1/START domain
MSDKLAPVVATVVVPSAPALAFEVFVDGMGTWWPVASHSLGAGRIVDVAVGHHAGGLVEEVWDDGTRKPWAEVLAFDPPSRLLLAWNPTDDPDERVPSTVEVTFEARGSETLVTVTHTGWEHWGEQARESYDEGWPVVLGGYTARFAA